MTPSLWQKAKGTKEPLDESKRGEWKSWLKTQHSNNEDHNILSHHFMANRWGNNGNSVRLYFGGLQNHCRWSLQPWNWETLAPWKKSYEKPAAAKSHQSCQTLCNPIDSSPPGSPVPGILQARTLEWVAISFSNVWKWKVKVKPLSRVQFFATPWTAAYQAPPSMGFSRQEYLEWGAIACSDEKPRQYIKKQRHYFSNKGPSSQSYDFSSSHVWL